MGGPTTAPASTTGAPAIQTPKTNGAAAQAPASEANAAQSQGGAQVQGNPPVVLPGPVNSTPKQSTEAATAAAPSFSRTNTGPVRDPQTVAEVVQTCLRDNPRGIIIGDTNHAEPAIRRTVAQTVLPTVLANAKGKSVVYCGEHGIRDQEKLDRAVANNDVRELPPSMYQNPENLAAEKQLIDVLHRHKISAKAIDPDYQQLDVFGPNAEQQKEGRLARSNAGMTEMLKRPQNENTIVVGVLGDGHLTEKNDVSEGSGLSYIRLSVDQRLIRDRITRGGEGADYDIRITSSESRQKYEKELQRVSAEIPKSNTRGLGDALCDLQSHASNIPKQVLPRGKSAQESLAYAAYHLGEGRLSEGRKFLNELRQTLNQIPQSVRETDGPIQILDRAARLAEKRAAELAR